MLIPLINKDPEANEFTCRDGEIEWIVGAGMPADGDYDGEGDAGGGSQEKLLPIVRVDAKLTATGTFPTATIRIALEKDEKEKVNLLLSGEISRVDAATAERLTSAILQKAAECLLEISTDLRRQGLFILPFRFYTMVMTPDGTLSYPSPQAIALPTDFPPHPEITAASATDDTLTLAIRFPVKPHRLVITPAEDFPVGYSIRTFISYPLYIPDPKEIRGSIGSVKSATGGNATGIRFAFLSTSAIKASVAAPEKYYEMVGNDRTGYRLSSKIAKAPDYSCYADVCGYVPAFPREALLALGDGVDMDTDPMDWIADWRKAGDGYLPVALPYKYLVSGSDGEGQEVVWPDGIGKDEIMGLGESLGMPYMLLTRPMALASDSRIRRNATPRAIRSLRIHGLTDEPALGILYGSNDCRHWEALRSFDPRQHLMLTPPRFWWRLLLLGSSPFPSLALEAE